MSPENSCASLPRRRTQAERRAATRAKIISAALDALGRVGYTQMRIGDVAASVGLSTGALTYHFPAKTDLALAAIEEGEKLVLVRLRRLVQDAADAPDRDARILDALYEVHAGIEFQAFLSAQAHARNDPELATGMNKIIVRATKAMGTIAAEGWGRNVAAASGFPAYIALTLGTVRGLVVIADVALPGYEHADNWPAGWDVWPEARRLLLLGLQELRAEVVARGDDRLTASP